MNCWLVCSIVFLLSGCCISQDETIVCVLFDIPNGFFMESSGSFNISNTTTYGCQTGFTTLQGLHRGETTCLLDGWVPKPECIKTCPKPVDENIIFSTTKPVALLEEKLIFECTDGHETINQKRGGQAVCTLKGWSPKPQCLSIECEIPILEHGSIHPRKDQYVNRDVVKFSCIRGYTRVGSDSAQCYHFGWSPQPPTCKEKVTPCQQPPRISHGNLIGDLHEEYQHGEKMAYECDARFGMVGSSTAECVDGEWMFLPSCIEEEKTCGPPPSITNGHPVIVDNKNTHWHGETVEYVCDQTFVILGTNPARCLRGQWEVPSCTDGAAKCRRPKNAKFVPYAPLTKMFDNGRAVNYMCGSSLHTTKCNHGKWSPEPECKVKEFCPPPPQLPNAINEIEMKNYNSGEEISFTCKEHFLLQGPQKILCKDGSWQTPPRCVEAEGRCGRPPSIENGDVADTLMTDYMSGATVHYKCLLFYRMEGVPAVHCHNGTWTERPRCTEACTITEEDMSYNNISLKLAVGPKLYIESGETAEFICKKGYQANPTSSPFKALCIAGKMEYPICIEAY
ncbi:complement factor H-related protein 5 [Anolis carolinensis]|uniref:complement factor H-related protein 5 n=1 Tax=Anolis carolinensis TaxID=28377 RepID=UPI002F2B197C